MSAIKSRKRPVVRLSTFADRRALGLAVASLAAMGAAQAAEPAAQVLQGVSVTDEVEEGGYKADESSSPKFTAPLLDTPQTVTVIKKELLDDQGLGSLADALRNTPGITFTLGENGNTTSGDSITMRGFDTSGSIFQDGVRDLGATSRDTFNTEQIEIVKGPSGSDNGRGAPTGYINLSSKQPTLVDAASSTLAFGTDNRVRIEGDLNQTLGAWDGAAARFNVMYDQGDRPGRSVADTSRWGFAPSLALGLGSETRAYFNYQFIKQINTPDGGLPPIGLDGYRYVSNVTVTNPTTEQAANLAALNTAISAMVAAADPVDRDNFYGSPDDFEHVRSNMFTATFEHDLSSSTTLRNTSRYGRQSLRRVVTGVNTLGNLYTGTTADAAAGNATLNTDPSVWTLSRSRQRRDEVSEVLTNQTNLRTAFETGRVLHTLSTGAEFILESQLSRGSASTGTTVAANLYEPSAADSMAALTRSGARNDGKVMTGAVYLFDTLQFSERWSLNAGVRFDSYRVEYVTVPAPAVPPATPAASTFVEAEGELLTGKLGVVFKPLPNGSIYAAWATSELPPGGAAITATGINFQLTETAGINNPNVDPQKAVNIEIGTKWDLLDNRLVLTAAAFDTRNKNDLTNPADPVTGEITQYGERMVRGVELGASGMITPDWQVTAGFTWQDSEVKEGTTTGNNPTQGAQLQWTPKLAFTSWTTYRFPSGLTIGGGARYTDSVFRNAGAAQATQANLAEAPSYWVIDAMAGYDVNERVALQLNVQNLTDEFYFSSVNNGGSRFTLGAPRTVLLSARVKF